MYGDSFLGPKGYFLSFAHFEATTPKTQLFDQKGKELLKPQSQSDIFTHNLAQYNVTDINRALVWKKFPPTIQNYDQTKYHNCRR